MTVLERPAVRLTDAEAKLVALLREAGADAAAERLQTVGLPTRRVEAFHFTDLKALLRQVPDAIAAPLDTDAAAVIPGSLPLRLVNGWLSGPEPIPGLSVETGASGEALSDFTPDVIAAALAPEAVRLQVLQSLEAPLHLDIRTEGPACVSSARVALELADGVSATVVTTLGGSDEAHFANAAMTVKLGKGAALTHVQIDRQGGAVRQFVHNDYALGEDSRLRTLIANVSAALNRVDLTARFDGASAHADFTGLNLIGGDQHADITLNASHAVAHTTSQELFKSVARDHATAVFQGKIVVERGAQKTDAKMMAQGLLLTDGAQVLQKPELEIFADDVVCGHGATCGDLDERSLFYLMSRGIPRPEAEAMLIRAFVAELTEPIEDDNLRGVLDGLVDGWLAGGARAEAA